jgi:predicted O-linked N-acetylglucosamine transferase (SPINDLY family)
VSLAVQARADECGSQRVEMQRVTVRVFAATTIREPLALAALRADVASGMMVDRLPHVRVEVVPGLPYRSFLQSLSLGTIGVDSYPFSGCNSMQDLLHAGVPTVTLEGPLWRSRIGGAMLRRLGLEWLVATSRAEFVDKVMELLRNGTRRAELRDRIARADLSLLEDQHPHQWRRGLGMMLDELN